MSGVLSYILLTLTNSCPRRDSLPLRNFYDEKTVAF